MKRRIENKSTPDVRDLMIADQQPRIRVDARGQRYIFYHDGQMRRLSPEGTPIPRVKLSKKQRRKLRKEYNEVRGLDSNALADKILETPVVNPIQSDPPAEGT